MVKQSLAAVKGQDLDGALKQLEQSEGILKQAETLYAEAFGMTPPPNPDAKADKNIKPAVSGLAMNQQKLLLDRKMIEELKKKIEELKKKQQQAQQQTQQAQQQQQKTEVEALISDQQTQASQLAAKKTEQSNMLAYNQSQQASYTANIQANNAQVKKLRAAQAAENARLSGGSKVIGGAPCSSGNGDTYPSKWCSIPMDSVLDSWGMYNRECVSYTAWKVYQKNGYMPYWGGRGNANQWPSSARADGIATGSTPKAGSVAISMSGYYGHAMWVEQVSGSQIYVSQMKYDLAGSYSEMWVDGSNFIYVYF
jgi:surface antigen